MLSDHLGSSSITTAADGTWNSEIRYSAFGETRYSSGITPTDYRYTGQLEQKDVNLYYYNARYYDAALGRFIQADTIIPEAGNSKSYDRYTYVNNNPMRYTDPSGHFNYDPETNTFTEGNDYDELQQQLLDVFVEQLESGKYTDLELTENLLNLATDLESDPVVALRAASEIVRENVNGNDGYGWSYSRSRFYYDDYTDENFDDSGFGDLKDTEVPNQISHFIGIAYIAAYQKREDSHISTYFLVLGNEYRHVFDQSAKQTQIDIDLGVIAVKYGEALITKQNYTLNDAVKEINKSENNIKPPKIRWPQRKYDSLK